MSAPRGVSTLAVELVSTAQIVVGVRRRKKLGNLRALARSIEQRGLIHPILVREETGELVAGLRRLRACQGLGWSKIPARRIARMTDEELRAVELEENTERLGLLDYETSRQRLQEIRQAEADLKAEVFAGSAKKGRPTKGAASRKDIAAITGMSDAGQRNTERHVALAEEYPIFQHPSWPQYRTLEAGEVLATLPETAREGACALIEKAGAPPEQAIAIFRNLAAMPEPRRTQILTAATSEDRHVVTRAVTDAAQLPPVPDEGLTALNEAIHLVRVAAKVTRFRAYRQQVLDLIPPMDDVAKGLRAAEEADSADPTELS